MTVQKLLRIKVATNKLIAKKINTANHFIYSGESLLPKPLLNVEVRLMEKMNRFNDPFIRALDQDSYERFHNPNYRS